MTFIFTFSYLFFPPIKLIIIMQLVHRGYKFNDHCAPRLEVTDNDDTANQGRCSEFKKAHMNKRRDKL